jgi:hypothetical protein
VNLGSLFHESPKIDRSITWAGPRARTSRDTKISLFMNHLRSITWAGPRARTSIDTKISLRKLSLISTIIANESSLVHTVLLEIWPDNYIRSLRWIVYLLTMTQSLTYFADVNKQRSKWKIYSIMHPQNKHSLIFVFVRVHHMEIAVICLLKVLFLLRF